MPVYEVRFRPKRPGRGRLEDLAVRFAGALRRNGQVTGEDIVWWKDGVLVITCETPEAGALDARHHSRWGRDALARLLAACAGRSSVRRLDRPARDPKASDWRRAGALFLYTGLLARIPPVRAMRDGSAVPVYRLPIDDVDRDRLHAWAAAVRLHDGIWLDSGALEMAAYRQLAHPSSALAREGRRLARTIEAATGVPTYTHLERYFRERGGEEKRRCPSCGGKWAWRGRRDPRSLTFDFQCERCRLVSDLGASDQPSMVTSRAPKSARRSVARIHAARARGGGGAAGPP